MVSSIAENQLPGLKAWEIMRRNRRRRIVVRSILSVFALGLTLPLLPDRFNPLVRSGAQTATDTDTSRAKRASDLSILLVQRAQSAKATKPLPRLSDAPPAELPNPTLAAADMLCLSKAVYFEARGEILEGQIAVAQVVMNRVRSSGKSACQVVYKGVERGEKCQFSFACYDHKLPSEDSQLWQQTQWVAAEVATGRAWLRELDKSEHYHTVSVAPIWRLGMKPARRIGQHIFYVANDVVVDPTMARKVKPRWDEPVANSWAETAKPEPELVANIEIKVPVKPTVVIKKAAPVVTPVRSEAFNPFNTMDQR
jgi:spore germination cell wall hydrolase CwlJ-like protein